MKDRILFQWHIFTWSASGGRLVCKGAYASTSGDLSGDYQMECRIESRRLIPTGQFSTFILTKDNSVMTDGDGNEIESPETQLYTLPEHMGVNRWENCHYVPILAGCMMNTCLTRRGATHTLNSTRGLTRLLLLNKTLTIKTTLWNVVTLSDKSLVLQRGLQRWSFAWGRVRICRQFQI